MSRHGADLFHDVIVASDEVEALGDRGRRHGRPGDLEEGLHSATGHPLERELLVNCRTMNELFWGIFYVLYHFPQRTYRTEQRDTLLPRTPAWPLPCTADPHSNAASLEGPVKLREYLGLVIFGLVWIESF